MKHRLTRADLALLDAVARRFEDDYFVRSVGDYLFCMPNFLVTASRGKLSLRLLAHVTEADEAAIRDRLSGLPYEIEAQRLTLEELERQTGAHFPAESESEDTGKQP
jgi:hypothetical protein